jgi:GNAT superfamily N-acetyltransferase
MSFSATAVPVREILPWREKFRQEMQCQIVNDSLHSREGWTQSYQLDIGSTPVGYGAIAVGGPWKGTKTAFEFFVAPEHRDRAEDLFEAFVASAGVSDFRVQTNAPLLTAMLRPWLAAATCERIVFRDGQTTNLPAQGAIFRRTTADDSTKIFPHKVEPVGAWLLQLDGTIAATGDCLHHYNPPFGDICMEVAPAFRKRGLGSYLVQELKRICREGGHIPCARCSPANTASHQTLLKAGFVECAQILVGPIGTPPTGARTRLG